MGQRASLVRVAAYPCRGLWRSWCVRVGHGELWRVEAVMVRRDMVWRGKLGHGEARWVTAVEVCSGWISYGMDSFGGFGKVR